MRCQYVDMMKEVPLIAPFLTIPPMAIRIIPGRPTYKTKRREKYGVKRGCLPEMTSKYPSGFTESPKSVTPSKIDEAGA